jgi:hypothetical protein
VRLRFSVAVLALACASFAALAAKPAVTAQAGSWEIGPINVKSGVNKFCSMKNTYQDGGSLVFARDAKGTNSMAFDFGAKTLQAGHQYQATLDLPPVLTREMTAVAATDAVLLVNMSKDKGFYEALGRMKALYLTTLGRDYSYDLSGSADALRELDECVAALAGGKTYAAARQPEPAAAPAQDAGPTDEIIRLRAQNKVLQRQAESLKAEAEAAEMNQAALDLARQAATEITMRQKQAEAENEKLRQALAEVQEKIGKQDALIAAARTERENKAIAQAEEKKQAAVQAEADNRKKLESENEKLKQSLAEARAKIENREETAAREEDGEAARLKQELAAARESLTKQKEVARQEKKKPVLAEARKTAAVKSEEGIEKILASSALPDGLVARKTGAAKTWKWQADDLFGSAEEMRVSAGGDFGGQVDAYFSRMAARCKGDFAHTASPPQVRGRTMTQKAEMACLDGKNDVAAALLFMDDGKNFTVVTHEGLAEQIRDAVEKRDAVASAVGN